MINEGKKIEFFDIQNKNVHDLVYKVNEVIHVLNQIIPVLNQQTPLTMMIDKDSVRDLIKRLEQQKSCICGVVNEMGEQLYPGVICNTCTQIEQLQKLL